MYQSYIYTTFHRNKLHYLCVFRILRNKCNIHPTQKIAFRLDIHLKLLNICQSTILNEELSIKILLMTQDKTRIISQKHLL